MSLLFSIQFISVVNEFIAMIDWENIFKMLNIIWGKVIWYLQAFEHSLFVRFMMIRALHNLRYLVYTIQEKIHFVQMEYQLIMRFLINVWVILSAVSHFYIMFFQYSSLSNILENRGKSRFCQNYYIETFGIFPYIVLKPFIMILLLIDRFGVWLESPWDPPPLVPMRLCFDMKFRI